MKAQAADMGLELLQISFGQEIFLYPISFREGVIAVLLGLLDDRKGPFGPEDAQRVTVACAKAGFALEIIALRKRVLAIPATV